jgi:1-acyl-sn-glycerol-3-phosphate acyltransferase
MKILLFFRGVIAIPLILIAMVAVSVTIILGGCVAYCMPSTRWRAAILRWLLIMPLLWGRANRLILLTGLKRKWDIQIPDGLSFDEWYLVLANHRSWADVLVLVSLFSTHIPLFKFFYKRELLWQLPFAGVAMWFLHYPHVARYSREKLRKKPELKQKSLDEIEDACAKLREAPTTIVNFAEGTRFTEAKRIQKKSPFQHLLPPKAQGISMVVNALKDQPDSILDVDILYSSNPSLWSLLSGHYRKISVHAHRLPADPALVGNYLKDRDYRRAFQDWINTVWGAKDKRLAQLMRGQDD